MIKFPAGGTMGERLRVARTAAGLSPREMAQAIGVSVRTYSRIEDNLRDLRLAELHALAARTGQDAEFFLGASAVDVEAPTLPLLPGAVNDGNDEAAA